VIVRRRIHTGARMCLVGLLMAAMTGTAAAQQADTPGSEDHPMVSRYEGSFIDGYEVREFDEFVLPLGPAVWNDTRDKRIAETSAVLEGRITRILYRGPDGRSSLEILRNYRMALEAAGFETLFSCGSDCGNNFVYLLYGPTEMRIRQSPSTTSAFDIPQDVRYLAARLRDGAREVHVSVLTAFDNGFGKLSKRPVTLVEIIETESMDTGMVTVDAEAIGKGIDADGHIAIYGVLFDTDSASIKPESAPVLAEIAGFLQARPDLQILVVGHTDNQGSYEYNMGLSAQRANAVVRYLTGNHDIDASRLRSAGVGFLAPVASNESAAGRAKNRRVELVRR
jgi:outer membrane protein OmpA-like peptidoglycan-associated protein